jgi:DNA-binding PucR family transcriptional regulator
MSSYGARVPSPSVGDVLDVLEAAGVTLLSSRAGRALSVGRPVLHDRRRSLPTVAGGILLVAAMDPDEVRGEGLVGAAAQAGYSAAAVKTYGLDATVLATLADRAGVALLGVPDNLDWLQLGSLVITALESAVQSGSGRPAVGDLFGLANAIAASVGGACAIEDFQQRILAYSNIPGQPIDRERREGILGRQVPDVPENADQYRALYRSTEVLHFAAEPPALPRVAVAVRAGGDLLGSIWVVDAEGAFSSEEDRSLLAAADMAALHLLRQRSAEDLGRHQRSELVRALLDGRADPARTVTQLGLDPAGPFAIASFEVAAPDDGELRLHRVVDMVTLRAESLVGRTSCALLGGTVYALVSGPRTRGGEVLVHVCEELVATARQSLRLDLVAAVGTSVDDPAEIGASRADADRALLLLRRHPHMGPVTSTTRASDQLSLFGLTQLLDAHPDLVSARARLIRAHDAAHGTAYETFLATWLDCQRDVAASAARMSTHPNTVRYRLRRAVELFALDLDDPDQMLMLWLSLRAAARHAGRGRPVERAR